MDVEKAVSKGYGFLNLFDWNKKSRNRLFGNGNGSSPSEKAGDGKEVDDGTLSSQSNLIDEDDRIGMSSMKGSSDRSCASSVIDEEGHGKRGPGVVARLMGLDSMPMASVSESYSIPSAGSQSFGNNLHEEQVAGTYIGGHFSLVDKGAEGRPQNPVELPHKMPSSPIDKFRMEALPPRSAKAFSTAQYKLLSPIKNPAYVLGRNAADIMEAASKIIGPGFETTGSYRVRDFGYASPVHVYNSRDMKVPQKSPYLKEALKKHDGATSARPLSGSSVNRRLKISENTTSSSSSHVSGADPAGPKVKGKATSPVTRATNAHGREGTSKYNRKVIIHKDPDEFSTDETGTSNHQKSCQKRRTTASASSALAQNNRKQNSLVGKHKLTSKPAVSSHQQDKVRSVDASSRKVRAGSMCGVNSDGGNRKEDMKPTDIVNRRTTSITNNFAKSKKLAEGRRMYSERTQSSEKIVVNRSHRLIQHNIVIDDQSAWSRNNKRTSPEIVSFTFTSPVDKSIPGPRFASQVVETQHAENGYLGSSSSAASNAKPDVIDGDYLGILLEQKLRELTSGDRSPYAKVRGGSISASSSLLVDATSACETSNIASANYEKESLKSFRDGQVDVCQPEIISQNDEIAEDMEYFQDQKEPEHLHLSPLSILEASLSTETCSSSESWKSANGNKLFASTEGTKLFDSVHLSKVPEVDAETEYSDTASSITVTTAEIPASEISSACCIDFHGQELAFVREILNASSLSHDIYSHCLKYSGYSEILDPLLLEELNDNIRLVACEGVEKDSRMRRKLLFDCVNAFLISKFSYYFNAGYGSWFKGLTFLGKLSAEELYQEMTGWKVAEESMVDELVDKEMSSPLGKWVNFEIESYEAGREIERELLSSLVDEMVADFLTEVPL